VVTFVTSKTNDGDQAEKIDKSYEIYMALYQGLTNYDEDKDAYREFSQDFSI